MKMQVLENILKLLKEKRINHTKFEKELGLRQGIVYDWINGRSLTYNNMLDKIAEYLGTGVNSLYNGEENVFDVDLLVGFYNSGKKLSKDDEEKLLLLTKFIEDNKKES